MPLFTASYSPWLEGNAVLPGAACTSHPCFLPPAADDGAKEAFIATYNTLGDKPATTIRFFDRGVSTHAGQDTHTHTHTHTTRLLPLLPCSRLSLTGCSAAGLLHAPRRGRRVCRQRNLQDDGRREALGTYVATAGPPSLRKKGALVLHCPPQPQRIRREHAEASAHPSRPAPRLTMLPPFFACQAPACRLSA